MTVQVTRFSFAGGKARPIQQPLTLTGVNQYDSRHISFTVTRTTDEGEKSTHVMSLDLKDVPAFASMFKEAVAQAKVALDTTPPEARKRLDARKAKEQQAQAPQTAPQDVNAILEALKQAGYNITPPATPAPDVDAPKATTTSKSTRRTATQTKPSTETKPQTVPALDDLDEIATSDLEAVSNIMAILLGKRGMK